MLILNELLPEYEQVSSLPQGYDEMSPLVEEYSSPSSQRSLLTDTTLSIYASAPSRFIVDGKSLYIHGQLVSRHSKPLSAKIKAKNDFAIIDSVDKDTFARFIEWAYKGYYTAAVYRNDAKAPSLSSFEDSDICTPEAEPFPSSEDALATPPTGPEPEPELELGWGSSASKKCKKTGKKTKLVWDEPAPAPPPTGPEPEPELEIGWGSFGLKKSKKTGKKTNVVWDESAPASLPTGPEPEPELELGWGSFASKKSKKTGKKTKSVWDEPPLEDPAPPISDECAPEEHPVPAEPAAECPAEPATESTLPEECPPEPQALKSSKVIFKESFFARKYKTRQDTITIPTPRPNEQPNENYTPVFLCHAHLYVFARKYDILPLEALALENLHMTLDKFTLYAERTGDIVELLRYIYGSLTSTWEAEEMREMLRGYIGFEMDVLMKDRDFRGLMKEEGDLLDDFVEMVGKRI